MPRRNRHIHKYFRVKLNGRTYWKCTAGECNHFMMGDLVIGNTSICDCGNKFQMTAEKMRRRAPKCDECQERKGLRLRGEDLMDTTTKQTILDVKIDDLLEGLTADESWKKGRK